MSRRHAGSLALLGCLLLGAAACDSKSPTEPDLDAPLDALSTSDLEGGPFASVLPEGQIVTGNDARELALVIFPGAAITATSLAGIERGLPVAEVRVTPAGGGGEVTLRFEMSSGLLAMMEADAAPFTYAVEPADGYASLALALEAATGSAGKAGTITGWRLQYEDNARWQYRVDVAADDGDWTVRVHGRTAKVNRVQEQ